MGKLRLNYHKKLFVIHYLSTNRYLIISEILFRFSNNIKFNLVQTSSKTDIRKFKFLRTIFFIPILQL
jgi:hypothetical protein